MNTLLYSILVEPCAIGLAVTVTLKCEIAIAIAINPD